MLMVGSGEAPHRCAGRPQDELERWLQSHIAAESLNASSEALWRSEWACEDRHVMRPQVGSFWTPICGRWSDASCAFSRARAYGPHKGSGLKVRLKVLLRQLGGDRDTDGGDGLGYLPHDPLHLRGS